MVGLLDQDLWFPFCTTRVMPSAEEAAPAAYQYQIKMMQVSRSASLSMLPCNLDVNLSSHNAALHIDPGTTPGIHWGTNSMGRLMCTYKQSKTGKYENITIGDPSLAFSYYDLRSYQSLQHGHLEDVCQLDPVRCGSRGRERKRTWRRRPPSTPRA